jgi:hypothetical protein
MEQGRNAIIASNGEFFKVAVGEEDSHNMSQVGNLASIYREQDRLEEAEAWQLRVIGTEMRVLGEEHLETLVSMHNLAVLQKQCRRFEEALDLAPKCHQLMISSYGESHPRTIIVGKTLHDWLRVRE